MRDALLFCIVFGLLPFIFKRPAIGVFTFCWLSLMNPHRLTYGAAFDFPFAAIVAAVTFIGLFTSKEKKRFHQTPVTVILIIFIAWMTFTTFFALEPELAWKEWNRVNKTLLMALLAMYVINTEKDVKTFVWVVGLSLAFYGFKGGLFTIKSGGASHVYGPAGSYIEDNNALALALLTTIPLIWYLRLQTTPKWKANCMTMLALLTAVSTVGSYSRGALLGGGLMLGFLWLKSQRKFNTAMILGMVALLVPLLMPDKWFDRMGTIDNYKDDTSAMGRINAWHFAANVAQQHPIGGGFAVFTPRQFTVYAPDPNDHHAAHSIYFQVLGEHGFIGLTLFIALMAAAWLTGSRIIRRCKNDPQLQWARNLAAMCQVSIIGFAVGGAFLTLAYYDLYYDIITILVVLEKILPMRHTESHPNALPQQQKLSSIGQ